MSLLICAHPWTLQHNFDKNIAREMDAVNSGDELEDYNYDEAMEDGNKPTNSSRIAQPLHTAEFLCSDLVKADLDNLNHSGKLVLLFSILKECEEVGDKLLVFSQSLDTLDTIEHFLKLNSHHSDPNKKATDYKGTWVHGLDYLRVDGNTKNRDISYDAFNEEDNERAR